MTCNVRKPKSSFKPWWDERGTSREEVFETMTRTERRARFIYEAGRSAAIAARAPVISAPWDQREENFKANFLKTVERQCGPQRSTSPKELHERWIKSYLSIGWKYGEVYSQEERTHPDLVSYKTLDILEQNKSFVFIALCKIAQDFI